MILLGITVWFRLMVVIVMIGALARTHMAMILAQRRRIVKLAIRNELPKGEAACQALCLS